MPFLNLKEDENGSDLKVLHTKQFVEANDQEHEPIRRIGKILKMF